MFGSLRMQVVPSHMWIANPVKHEGGFSSQACRLSLFLPLPLKYAHAPFPHPHP